MRTVCTKCGIIIHGIDKDGVRCDACRQGDTINHPSHYTAGKVECIDAIEAATTGLTGIQAVCTANVIKYMWRWKRKNGVEDLRKARWYLDKLIESEEAERGMSRLSDKQILQIADHKGQFTVSWQWRNDALRRHCVHLMNRGLLVMTWSRGGEDRFSITETGREFLRKEVERG